MKSAMILPCGVNSAQKRAARRELEDIGADEAMQKAARVVAGNLDHAAVREAGRPSSGEPSGHQLKLGCSGDRPQVLTPGECGVVDG